MMWFHSLWLNNIPLCIHTIFSISIHLLTCTWVDTIDWLLWIGYISISFPSSTYLGSGIAGSIFSFFPSCTGKLRSLHYLGSCFTSWAIPPALFALGIFQIRSHISSWTSLDCNPHIYTSCIAGMTGTYHPCQNIGQDGVLRSVCPACLKSRSF
jgi:hypothetical protein